MVKINALIEIDENILKEIYNEDHNNFSLDDAIEKEFGWLNQSGIYLDNYQIIKDN